MCRFCVVTLDRARAASPDSLAQDLAAADGAARFASFRCEFDPESPDCQMSLRAEQSSMLLAASAL